MHADTDIEVVWLDIIGPEEVIHKLGQDNQPLGGVAHNLPSHAILPSRKLWRQHSVEWQFRCVTGGVTCGLERTAADTPGGGGTNLGWCSYLDFGWFFPGSGTGQG